MFHTRVFHLVKLVNNSKYRQPFVINLQTFLLESWKNIKQNKEWFVGEMLNGIGCKKYTKHIIPKSLQSTKMDAYHNTWTKEAYFLI